MTSTAKISIQKRKLKVRCPQCEQKLDLSTLPPFSIINCPVCEEDILVPKYFGPYLLLEIIGQGGMSKVYHAIELELDREVAIKILNPDSDVDLCSLFLNEARAAAAVNHTNIVPIFSCGTHKKSPYMAMQHIVGGSLDHLIINNPIHAIPAKQIIEFTIQTALGLQAALNEGIVHHDVKPGNMLFDTDTGQIKITDFGLAQSLNKNHEAAALTASWGSPIYISPEKAEFGFEDYRGDIYSLGASLYHMLSGKPPFCGDNLREIMQTRIGNPPPDIRAIAPQFTAEITDFLQWTMQPKPEDRLQDYTQFTEVLQGLLAQKIILKPVPKVNSETD